MKQVNQIICLIVIISLAEFERAGADPGFAKGPAFSEALPKASSAEASTIGLASYFTVESCKREGTSGIMASKIKLADHAMFCALPGRPDKWGKRIRVINMATGKSIVVAQMDIGPGKKARRRGVVIDLTQAAFIALGGKLRGGKLEVKIEKLDSRFHGNDRQQKGEKS